MLNGFGYQLNSGSLECGIDFKFCAPKTLFGVVALCKKASNHHANPRHFDYCPSASSGNNQSVGSSAPVVSRCFPGGYNVKLYISRARLAWWLLAFLCCVENSHFINSPWDDMGQGCHGKGLFELYIIRKLKISRFQIQPIEILSFAIMYDWNCPSLWDPLVYSWLLS